MASEWAVVIVTYKRAGRLTTDRVVNDALIVCPQSQAEAYREHAYENGAEIFPCPDAVDGNVARKRNWVLDQFEGQNVVLMDDDYTWFGRCQGGEQLRLSPDQVDDLLWNGFQMAADLGTVMWGVNQQSDPKFYREYSPFSLLSPILGPFQAFAATPIRYDEDLPLKEDYDMWLKTVWRYRKTLRFNGYHYGVQHIGNEGGVVASRSMVRERDQIRRLQKRWGKKVVQIREDTINPRVRVPLRGI